MKKWICLLLVFMTLATAFNWMGVNHADAATLVSKSEAESMTKAGSYTGNISSPFSGAALYANGDLVKNNASFGTIPGVYEIQVKGASSNASSAGVSIYVGGTKAGAVSFANSTPSVQTVQFNVTAGTSSQEVQLKLETDNGSNDTYIDYYELYYVGAVPPPLPAPVPPSTGAYASDVYRNLFQEWGKSTAEINSKLSTAYQQLFFGDNSNQRIFYPVGTDMGYILDTGNNDVRSEGMSYGMMIAVQMNDQDTFNRLWKWAKTYMQNTSGTQQGYFAWQVSTSGNKLDQNPASDGEAYFITSLFFAAHRWGNGTGIFNYETEAQTLLDRMLTPNGDNKTMYNLTEKQVVFVPYGSAAGFTDPSYHLPAFTELWALWDNDNNQFWRDVAATSRTLFQKQANPTTGLGPDYAEFTGAPNNTGNHGDFRFDAWRTISNMAVDYAWWAKDNSEKSLVDKLQNFFYTQGVSSYGNQYSLNGNQLDSSHSTGLVATNAAGSLAATTSKAWDFVSGLWSAPIPTGQYRYYDGSLYMLSMLHASGNFKVYKTTGGGGSPSDTQAPTVPTGLTATSTTDSSVTLSWNASSDNVGVTGYEVFRGTTSCGTPAAASVVCSGLAPGTAYSFTVKARDAAGNWSAASSPLAVTTSASSGGGSTGTVVWSDDFESGTGNWSNYNGNWSAVTDGTKVYTSGSVYETGTARAESQNRTNYMLEARVKVHAVNTGNRSNMEVGIAGRVQNQSNYYIAYFDGSKNMKLAKVVNGSWTVLGTYAGNFSEGVFHTVSLSMYGSAIKVSVDGTERIAVTDNQFASGKIAVYADQATGRYDDVKIYQ